MTTEAIQQAIKACDFWAGLEYLNLVSAPEAEERRSVFSIESDADLPWLNPTRKHNLGNSGNRFKAQIAYCGLFPKAAYTFALRSNLGATTIEKKDLGRGDAAMLLIPLDDTGRVCGESFVSSLAWMMGRLHQHITQAKSAESLRLGGFEEFLDELMLDIRRKLVQLQLIRDDEKQKPSAQEQEAEFKKNGGKICGDKEMQPLCVSDVYELLCIIWNRCGWCPPGWTESRNSDQSNLVRIKIVTMTRHLDRSVDLGALNSLVANDVMRVRDRLSTKRQNTQPDGIGKALRQYLKLQPPPLRTDLRDDALSGGLGVFIDALTPNQLPLGAWPDFPLVAAQQFAVNMSRHHLADGGLYGVNGPPGTGKSTLLRDVIADLIVDRAVIMANYSDPKEAFIRESEIEGHGHGFWELDSALHGHGIVVASSNNGAVENVIKDLPKLTNPIREAGLRYFSEVSDSIVADQKNMHRSSGSTWGLVAALLGSSDKRRAFMSRFWFEDTPAIDGDADPQRLRSLKGFIERKDHTAVPWTQAVMEFSAARLKMKERAEAISSHIELVGRIKELREQVRALTKQIQTSRENAKSSSEAEHTALGDEKAAERRLSICLTAIAADSAFTKTKLLVQKAQHEAVKYPSVSVAKASEKSAISEASSARRHTTMVLAAKPGFWEALFHWASNRRWRMQLLTATESEQAATERARNASQIAALAIGADGRLKAVQLEHATCETAANLAIEMATQVGIQRSCDQLTRQQLDDALTLAKRLHIQAAEQSKSKRSELQSLEKSQKELEVRLQYLNSQLADIDKELGPLEPDFLNSVNLLQKKDSELQLTVPYNDATLRRLRIDVFRLAMQLNESFVVASWVRLRKSLALFVDYQAGKFSTGRAANATGHLWNAFFLVVPVVSSTFASFGRLFAGLGQEQIGMLLIDEAGQSSPQNAIGAIWRSRRVIAVGDPLQLEPVVTQPSETIVPWREWIGASKHWTPPACSVQVLADEMTPYGTQLNVGGIEDRQVWVGSPLRVHRRCLNPMFDAANEIAYAKLMVNGVRDDTHKSDWIGPSQWFDVCGEGVGHWIKAQGDFTLDLIKKLRETPKINGQLKNDQDQWHINIITPYKDVGTDFRSMLSSAFPDIDDIKKMAGTIHTFQGKEADIVILLLGGNPERKGAVSFFAGNEQSPNLLNVALTRAKKRIYVVGDRSLWVNNSSTFRRFNQLLEQSKIH